MKKLLILTSLIVSSSLFACADLKNKPAWLNAKKIQCGKLSHKIIEPLITIQGRTLPFAMDMGDMWEPYHLAEAYPPYVNIVRRRTAICKSFGMGESLTSNDFGIWRDRPDVMAALKRNASGKFAPSIVKIDQSRRDYSYTKSISCLPNYSKR